MLTQSSATTLSALQGRSPRSCAWPDRRACTDGVVPGREADALELAGHTGSTRTTAPRGRAASTPQIVFAATVAMSLAFCTDSSRIAAPSAKAIGMRGAIADRDRRRAARCGTGHRPRRRWRLPRPPRAAARRGHDADADDDEIGGEYRRHRPASRRSPCRPRQPGDRPQRRCADRRRARGDRLRRTRRSASPGDARQHARAGLRAA